MDHFQRRDSELYAEDVPLRSIAYHYGTPTYVYSRATLQRHVRVLQQALSGTDHLICYAVKANGNLSLLQLFQSWGLGFDAVSVGELARVLKAGGAPERTILSGVGKRDDEIATALECGVLYICVESAEELEAVARIARSRGVRAPVSIRVNPDVDPQTHPYIATGLKDNKFGVPWCDAPALYERALANPALQLIGLTCHIGSQITELAPFVDAGRKIAQLAGELRAAGVPLRYLGMGGGLGIPYSNEAPPSPDSYGKALADIVKPLGLTLVVEPGRVITGNAGVLLASVIRRKPGAARPFVIIDAAMNDLVRPALYQAEHALELVTAARGEPQPVDIVGPVCESADTLARARPLPPLAAGDLIAIRTAGAYGFVMSSTYNGRPRPAEILVDGSGSQPIRLRESVSALWTGEMSLEGQPFNASIPERLAPGK